MHNGALRTLADLFFHSAFGGSFLNHFFLVSAAIPVFPNAPASMRATVDSIGRMVREGTTTPDGFVVNTAYTVNQPHPEGVPAEVLVPNQTMPNVGDRLSAKNVSWAWFAGGWDDALAGHPDPSFQFHHQPFAYFANYADGTAAKAAHLEDETEFLAAARAGRLPAVRDGPNWKDAAIIVTYDENGGLWDHVAPPVVDKWGPGTRIPAIVISLFARRGGVDHTTYETASILALIEKRWGLAPLAVHDARANPLTNAFDFTRRP